MEEEKSMKDTEEKQAKRQEENLESPVPWTRRMERLGKME